MRSSERVRWWRRSAAVWVVASTALTVGCAPGTPPASTAPRGTGAVAGSTTTPAAATPGTSTVTTASSTTTVPTAPATGVLRTPTGVLVPLRGRRLDGSGWVVGTPCGREAVVRSGTQAPGARVVLDPGHGGEESGTISPNDVWESVVNLDVAVRVERLLRERGVTVELTRRSDVQVTLAARAELAVALGPELIVSVHHNGGHHRTGDDPGTLTFHQVDAPASRRLAGVLYEDVTAALAPLDLRFGSAAVPGAYAVRNTEGVDYYALLRHTAGVPAVIVETMYLTGPDEADAIEREDVRQIEAQGIADGILRYLTTADPGSGYRAELQFGQGSMPDAEPSRCDDPALG